MGCVPHVVLSKQNIRHRDLRRVARRAFAPVEHFDKCERCTPTKWRTGKTLCPEGARLRKDADALTLHALRHTAASLLIGAVVNVKAVSERLGHASTGFTMDTYVHLLPTAQEAAAVALEALVFTPGRKAAAK